MAVIREKRFKATRDKLPIMLAWVEQCSRNDLTHPRSTRLLVAAEEVLVNIVSYAYKHEQKEQELVIRRLLSEDTFILEFEDNGQAFNPLGDVKKSAEVCLTDMKPGGLGRLFMQKFVDDISYLRTETKNILRLIVRR